MATNIQIIEKPDWVTWESIKHCLIDAHQTNREQGINMTNYQWPVEKMKDSLGEKGVMLVALDGERVVGTAGIAEKKGKSWYINGPYAYMCFACVLPEYRGKGIYKLLFKKREEYAKKLGYNIFVFYTHCRNQRVQNIARKNGFRYVSFFLSKNKEHYCVVMAKWIEGCPYTKLFCWWQYQKIKFKTIIGDKMLHR